MSDSYKIISLKDNPGNYASELIVVVSGTGVSMDIVINLASVLRGLGYRIYNVEHEVSTK